MKECSEYGGFFSSSAPKLDYYYHSVGGMNPAKLVGILEQGILSRNEAVKRGLIISTQGLGCNGNNYISLGISFGYGVNLSSGSFHFIVDYRKVKTHIRPNPVPGISGERQIYQCVPLDCILGIRIERNSLLDIEQPEVKLGINVLNKELMEISIQSIYDFLKNHFQYTIPEEDLATLSNLMASQPKISHLGHFESKKAADELTFRIESLLKKHLKICYKHLLKKDEITGLDIIRAHNSNIPVYNEDGYLISAIVDGIVPPYIGKTKKFDTMETSLGERKEEPTDSTNENPSQSISWIIYVLNMLISCIHSLLFCSNFSGSSESETSVDAMVL